MRLWNRVEDAGHRFTMVAGPTAGRTLYYCEWCASLLIVAGVGEVEVFHPTPSSILAPKAEQASLDRCLGKDKGPMTGELLKQRLDAMHERDYERMKGI